MKCPICGTELDQETYYDFVDEDTGYYNFCPKCEWNDHPEYSYFKKGDAMMNIDILVTKIKSNTNLEVSVHDVQKGNVTLTGISIGNGTVRPTLYTRNYEDLYDKYGYDEVAKKMLEDAINAEVNHVDMSCMEWEYAKENLKLCIAPKGTNRGVVTYPYLDLELYVRVMIKEMNNVNGYASYKVNQAMLDKWNVSSGQLLRKAFDCTVYKVKSMSEILFGVEEDSPLLVVRTEDEMYGASAMYCKDILKQVADKFDSDLLIIPSSIHEILLQPIENLEFEGINKLINDVNTEQLEPEEVLSDHAYIFHKDTSEITW